MSKSFSTFAATALFVAFSQSNASYIHGELKMRNYVNESTAQLFYPNHEQPEVRKFQNDVAQKINRNCNEGWWTNYYNTARVYEAILNESVNFIEKQACECAKNKKLVISFAKNS